jgi:hypothetical protein
MSLLYEIEKMCGWTLEVRDVEGFDYKERLVPREDRLAGSGGARNAFSGGVMGRGRGPGAGQRRQRRF